MKNSNKKIINYLLISIATLVLTACGGGSGGSSGSCLVKLPDTDGDGFHDGIDPAFQDASNPGDFSTPEKILANPKVKKALAIAKSHGVNMAPQLGKNPPNLTGYYHKDIATGSIVASETGAENGAKIAGVEENSCSDGSWYQEKAVEFVESGSERYHKTDYNVYLRGSGKQFSYYKLANYSCDRGGSSLGVYIYSGSLDTNGNQVNVRSVQVQLSGSSNCEAWKVRTHDTYEKVNDIDNLTHMCVDEGKTYFYKDTWKNKGGESCRCNSDYESVCN